MVPCTVKANSLHGVSEARIVSSLDLTQSVIRRLRAIWAAENVARKSAE